MADVARIVADFELADPVAFGHQTSEPLRVIGHCKQADPLRGQNPPSDGKKTQQHPVRIIIEARQFGRVSPPLRKRHFERLCVLLLIMIDDGQRQACFEFGERQAGALATGSHPGRQPIGRSIHIASRSPH